MIRPRPARAVALAAALVAVVALGACTSSGSGSGSGDGGSGSSSDIPGSWGSALAGAKGQTVHWYMYGGDATLNTFVADYVKPRLKALGVTLDAVKIDDTADAVNKVLGQKQAGRTSGGAVDAIWINGENFASGVQSDLWYCGWARSLPNSKYVDFTDPAVTSDFGVPVKGCESAWQSANSALVYDSAKLTASDVSSISNLFAWAKTHPGRFTYPALPDFTGSMAVRTILYDTIGGPSSLTGAFDTSKYDPAATKLFDRLTTIAPTLWRGGKTYPQSQDAVEKLYGNGEISAYFTYGPGSVGEAVKQGRFPSTTREAVPSVGNIANVSNIAIPADAAHRDGALVLANLLQDPQTQLALYKAEGVYPGIDLTKTTATVRSQFAAVPVSPSVLPLTALTANTQPELVSGYVTRIEKDWKTKVLQR